MTIVSTFLAAFEVGIPVIDEEHGKLLVVIDELKYCADEPIASSRFAAWQRRFADLTAAHFADEEAWMVRLEIPEPMRIRHAEEHQRMLLEARRLGSPLPALDLRMAGDVYKLLKVEFFRHFVQFDAKLKTSIASAPPPATQEEAAC